jgi:hypothetical protein
MKTSQLREVALATVRVEMKRLGLNPDTAPVEDAQDVLEEIACQHPGLLAVTWFKTASQSQLRLFDRDYKAKQKARAR